MILWGSDEVIATELKVCVMTWLVGMGLVKLTTPDDMAKQYVCLMMNPN